MAGAVGKGKEDDLEEAYALLGVEEDASDKEIQSAFRKLSLKVHPDRNPDDPNAADKFDQLSRAKDLLLDPVRRAELDRKRTAARELEERFQAQDEKRKNLCKDLNAREAAALAGKPRPGEGPSPAELKKRAAQMDYSARLKAKAEQMAGRQNEVVSEVVQTRATAEEGRLRVSWRAGGPPSSMEVIRKALVEFDIVQIEMSTEGAVVQLNSREDAVRAVLECRQRKHQLPFRASLATAKKPEATAEAEAPGQPSLKRTHTSPAVVKKSFDAFEADMFAGLQALAKKQKTAKS